jgi:hypothetical protein
MSKTEDYRTLCICYYFLGLTAPYKTEIKLNGNHIIRSPYPLCLIHNARYIETSLSHALFHSEMSKTEDYRTLCICYYFSGLTAACKTEIKLNGTHRIRSPSPLCLIRNARYIVTSLSHTLFHSEMSKIKRIIAFYVFVSTFQD